MDATMLSSTVNPQRLLISSTTSPLFLRPLLPHRHPSSAKPLSKPISAASPPSTPQPQQQQQLYQPFRPPPSPLPAQFRSLDTAARLDVLSNRLGLWYQYAPLIPALYQEGFNPPSIEESTGISGVEQNRLIVAAQVRDSLVQFGKLDPETLAFFDSGGAELLYEIRLLSASQRTSAAHYIVTNRFDGRGAQELARAVKDFPRRKGDKGWESFDYNLPGDCLAFMRFRQSREHPNPSAARTAALESAVEAAESEAARGRVLEELKGGPEDGKVEELDLEKGVKVPVVRMKVGEVAEAKAVVVLPVCTAEEREKELEEAPWECKGEGEFGVVAAEKAWRKWVVLPGWEPLVGLTKGGVAVSFIDARALPWNVKRWYKEEAILVVADRVRKEVTADDGFYLVSRSNLAGENWDGLKVERGSTLKKLGVEVSIGTVVLVVRPPKEEVDDQLGDDDWE